MRFFNLLICRNCPMVVEIPFVQGHYIVEPNCPQCGNMMKGVMQLVDHEIQLELGQKES